ncbi:MAG: indolepyruvate oxidoreductase subunit beta [Thermoplasmata archaeon]|nr:indolepyruvate oxidoreductase subunit beta [Thermoplasmata archaeon]
MKNENVVTIHIVGVGGQGALTVSKILGNASIEKGVPIIVSEVHGMAQRGGVVQTTIRLGDTISPLAFASDITVVVGFEPLEAYRAKGTITSDTMVIVNTDPISPVSVSSAGHKYPDVDEVLAELGRWSRKVYHLSGSEKAAEAGNSRVSNVVMLGALAGTGILPFSKEELDRSIRITVPEKAVKANIKGFELGYDVTVQ